MTSPDTSNVNASSAPLAPPPSYTARVDPRRDRLPPYKASHGFANSAEELAALKEFAESKMYIEPGTQGTLPDIRGGMGLQSMAWGGPMGGRRAEYSDYHGLGSACWPAPETAEQRRRRRSEEKEKKRAERERRGSVKDRLMRVISGTSSKGE